MNTDNYFGGNDVEVNAQPVDTKEEIPQLDAPIVVNATPDENPYMVENNFFN